MMEGIFSHRYTTKTCFDTQKGREYKRADMRCVLDSLRLIYFWMTDSMG